jgi:serine/threonine protein kinase
MDHPNLTRLIEINEDEEKFILIMELVELGDLFDFLEEKGNFQEKDLKEIVYVY